jgi:hypothetical protein
MLTMRNQLHKIDETILWNEIVEAFTCSFNAYGKYEAQLANLCTALVWSRMVKTWRSDKLNCPFETTTIEQCNIVSEFPSKT